MPHYTLKWRCHLDYDKPDWERRQHGLDPVGVSYRTVHVLLSCADRNGLWEGRAVAYSAADAVVQWEVLAGAVQADRKHVTLVSIECSEAFLGGACATD